MNSDKKNRGIIVFLLLSLLAIGILSYQNAKYYSELQQAFLDEKTELKLELDRTIADYDNVVTEKINLSTKIRKERNKIIQLRDSLKNLKGRNYSLIRKYRKRFLELEKQNKILFAKVDSLNKANTSLRDENIAVKEKLDEKSNLTNKLEQTNESLKTSKKDLEEKIAIAEVLEINDLTVVPLKKRSNGSYTSTSRSKKIEAFKVSFDILKNEIAKKGNRKVYIQLVDMDRKIISADGSTVLKDGSKIVYSDVFKTNYQNREMSLVNLVKIEKGLVKKGKYIVNTYIEGDLVGNRIVELR